MMNRLKILLVGLSVFSFVMIASCASEGADTTNDSDSTTVEMTSEEAAHDHENDVTETTDDTSLGKEFTSAYVCPMHCEGSGGEETGNCPVCEMEYMENPNPVEN